MGIHRRLKLYSGLNLIGWIVAMPVLMVGLLSPFVNFSAWPGASVTEKKAQVALLPPQLTEQGTLPPLTARPQPSARVPEHATIVHAFTSAAAKPSPRRAASAPSRRQLVRSGPGATRRRPTSVRTATGGAGGPKRPGLRAPNTNAPSPSQGQAPAKPAPSNPRPEGPPSGNPSKPQDPQHGEAGQPAQSQSQSQGNGGNGNGNGNGKPDDPQHGQAGKSDDPQHGRAGETGDPNPGEHGKP